MTASTQLRPPVAPTIPDDDLTTIGDELGNDILTAAIAADHARTSRPSTAKRAWTSGGNGD